MYLEKITLKNFRNHNYLTYTFKNNINIFLGENGVGKTNIIEAIYYLSFVKSFRGVEDSELIQHEKDSATIEAKILEGKISKDIKVILQDEKRYLYLNGKLIPKISELSKNVNIILFEPKDVMLFRGPPKDRRLFLDVNLSKKSQAYLDYISRYERILKERNELLKKDQVDEVLLKTTTELLIKLTAPIISYRTMYFKDINDILNNITRALTGERGKFEIIYKPFAPNNSESIKNITSLYEKALETDIKKKVTTIGVHKEDFSITYNGKDLATYGSQGENRLAAIALKLAPYFLIKDKDKRPIIMLDDVMSELDEKHQKQFINFLSKFEQIFITTTKPFMNGAKYYEIKK